MSQKRVRVRAPATTANLGPGFDCLGMALDIFNEVTVEVSEGFSIAISGEGKGSLSRGRDNRLYEAVEVAFLKMGRPVPSLRISMENRIPLARGLGSSAAAVAAGLVAANLLCGEPLSLEELIMLGQGLEGHPDNIAPALLGGCVVVVREGEGLVHARIPLPEGLKAVLYIPYFEMSTQQARDILPSQVSREDAVHNIGRVALLVAALASGELDHLNIATQDRLHQHWRQALFPAMGDLFQAARRAGALGVFLSGAGSTILALTKDRENEIAEEMRRVAREKGVKGRVEMARPSLQGAHAVDEEEAWP